MKIAVLIVLTVCVLSIASCNGGQLEPADDPDPTAAAETDPEATKTPEPEELLVASRVGDVRLTGKQLVHRILVLGAIRAHEGGTDDPAAPPFEYVHEWTEAEILRQQAPGMGIVPSDEAIESELRRRFLPQSTGAQNADSDERESEFQTVYAAFLESTGIPDSEYREIVEEELTVSAFHQFLGQDIADPQEQVEVQWIRLPPDNEVSLEELLQNLREEPFESVARDVSQSAGYSDASGYVGWIPRVAFPDLERALFGDKEFSMPPIPVGEMSQPIWVADGVYILRILSEPEVRDISEQMKVKLTTELVNQWQQKAISKGLEDDSVKLTFNSSSYDWVLARVLEMQEDKR